MSIWRRATWVRAINVSVEKWVETVKHYILDCCQYENESKQMRMLFKACGINDLDLNILLDTKRDNDYKDQRSFILLELENYVAET